MLIHGVASKTDNGLADPQRGKYIIWMYSNKLEFNKLSDEEQKIITDYMTKLFQIGIDFITTKTKNHE